MKNPFSAALLVLVACSATKPIDPPGQVPPGPAQMPGDRAPASTSESWTTQGGPAAPGSPSVGNTVTSTGTTTTTSATTTTDGAKDGGAASPR